MRKISLHFPGSSQNIQYSEYTVVYLTNKINSLHKSAILRLETR